MQKMMHGGKHTKSFSVHTKKLKVWIVCISLCSEKLFTRKFKSLHNLIVTVYKNICAHKFDWMLKP